jgi:thioredoxin-like negative regulator of GroEL
MVVIGTDNCFYCRKLEAGPLKDPSIGQLLSGKFVALKLDATRAPDLAKALRVQMYPTTVIAAPDGKIHAFIEGYVDADRLGEQLKRTSAAVATAATADWAARDLNEASKALAVSDYPRAVTLLKGIAKDAGDKPVGAKARLLLEEVEHMAAGQVARAGQLEQRGQIPAAMDTLAEVVKQYPGTHAAGDAAALLAGLAEKPETVHKRRQRIVRDLIALARDDFRAERLYDCLQKCEQIASTYADLPEARDAAALVGDIRSNPERMAKACEQMNERTATMYLSLADSWSRKGQPTEAAICLKKVMILCPNTRHSDQAQIELVKLQNKSVPATPAGLMRP